MATKWPKSFSDGFQAASSNLFQSEPIVIFAKNCINNRPTYFFFQAEARRTKVKESRKRREERQALKKQEMLAVRFFNQIVIDLQMMFW